MKRTCQCDSCKFSRRAKTIKANGSHQQKNKLIDTLMNNMYSAEEDNCYYKAIHDGSWPQAVEILERCLVRAKAKNPEKGKEL